MLSLRSRILFALIAGAIAFGAQAPLHGNDKPDAAIIQKRKTTELLEKATEEYRVFFKKPDNAIEFWAAIKFEMDLGKFDLAAYHMKLMLEKMPPEDVDKDLVKLEQVEGITGFMRLRLVRQWSDYPPFQEKAVKDVETLITRVTEAVNKHLSDPVRIAKFIKQLDAPTPEERSFAYVQLARSGERAVPYLIAELRVTNDKPIHPRLKETMVLMGKDRKETVPVYLDALRAVDEKDARDLDLRLTLLDIVHRLDDKRAIPYLWHLSSAKQYPPPLRKKAHEVLASLMHIDVIDVPPAKEALTQMAERYYQEKPPIGDDKAAKVKVWEWTGQEIVQREKTPFELEESLGMRYARQALDLDSTYLPAQIVMLNLMLERTFRSKIDQFLLEPMAPKMHQFLTTLDAELAMRVLERGMEDREVAVILPLIQTLGERGEVRAARLGGDSSPRGIVRALYYPDRRVQLAAMKAMLRMPSSTAPAVASDRIVDLARRFLASEPTPKALVVYAPVGQEKAARDAVKGLGYEADTAVKTSKAIEMGKASADYDLVILHRGVPDNEFAFAYAQLRQDFDLGGLPLIVIVDKNREKAVKKFTAKDRGVIVVTEEKFQAADEFKKIVEDYFTKARIVKLSAAERSDFAKLSMDTLWRMARGEITGYDVRPALDVIKKQLNVPDNTLRALEILGRLPGKEIQVQLAGIVSNPDQDVKLRMPAVLELNRHMQKNGVQVDKKQIANLLTTANQAAEGTPFRAQLNITVSLISRSTSATTGADLFKFRPDVPMPKEKDKKAKDD